MQVDQALAWRGRTAVDANGDKIGNIEEIYLDADTNEPEWLAVKTGLFGTKLSFVPIAEASERDGEVVQDLDLLGPPPARLVLDHAEAADHMVYGVHQRRAHVRDHVQVFDGEVALDQGVSARI